MRSQIFLPYCELGDPMRGEPEGRGIKPVRLESQVPSFCSWDGLQDAT